MKCEDVYYNLNIEDENFFNNFYCIVFLWLCLRDIL